MKRRIVAVVGPTGAGKSALAVELALSFGGEVVNTDVWSLYRGMDIGSAKVDAETRARVRHHLIDVADPDDTITLARYLDLAKAALDDIWGRSKLPVLVGGSGQYVWALLEGWQVPRVAPDLELRRELEVLAEREGASAVHARLAAVDPEAAARLDAKNTRRVIRAIEVVTSRGLPLSACQTRQPIDAEVLMLGLRWPRDELYARLDARTVEHYEGGLIDEVRRLRESGYGESAPMRGGVGYREVSAYLDGEYGLEEAIKRTQVANHRLVRRQGAWFREGDERIVWVDGGEGARGAAVGLVGAWLGAKGESFVNGFKEHNE